jgi:hypothetical protein
MGRVLSLVSNKMFVCGSELQLGFIQCPHCLKLLPDRCLGLFEHDTTTDEVVDWKAPLPTLHILCTYMPPCFA